MGVRINAIKRVGMKVTDEEFAELAARAVDSIPDSFHVYLNDIAIDIEDLPDQKTCDEMEIDDPQTLMGLYRGTPLTHRNVEAPCHFPDRIVIYKTSIESVCRTRRQIVEQVRKTVLHEIGHHFGLDEDDLDELGYA